MSDRDAIAARTQELMTERSIPWADAWRIASAELGTAKGRTVRIRHSATWAALVGGVLLVGLPSVVVQAIWPGWMSTPGSEADTAAIVWFALLGLSGVVVIGVAVFISFRSGSSLAARLLLRVYAGVAFGMWLSVIVMGINSYDVGAVAAIFAMFIGLPFWACAGIGIAVGRGLYAATTPADQRIADKIHAGYFEASVRLQTSDGVKGPLDLRVGDRFKDSNGAGLEVLAAPTMRDRDEITVAVKTEVGQGVRRWHIGQLKGYENYP